MQATFLINGTPSSLDANDRVLIRTAAKSDEARKVVVDEIEGAEAEGDHEFANAMRVILRESDRLREDAKRHPASHGVAHLSSQPMAAADIGR